jgi:hypothetical protein
MGEFSPEWLALREPADVRARAAGLARDIGDRLGRSAVDALDLAGGTGANVRYLAPLLQGSQRWLLVDEDERLMAHVPGRMRAWAEAHGLSGFDVATRRVDLAGLVDARSPDLFRERSLVTASALLDLVSARWLDVTAARCREAGVLVLFALTYDGRIECEPAHRLDATVRDLVNLHQRTDKGFGPALGPDATACAAGCLADYGYSVRRERSDWKLRPGDRDLQRQLVLGWAGAAEAIGPAEAAGIREWRAARLAHVEAGRSSMVVGHEDLAAWL